MQQRVWVDYDIMRTLYFFCHSGQRCLRWVTTPMSPKIALCSYISIWEIIISSSVSLWFPAIVCQWASLRDIIRNSLLWKYLYRISVAAPFCGISISFTGQNLSSKIQYRTFVCTVSTILPTLRDAHVQKPTLFCSCFFQSVQVVWVQSYLCICYLRILIITRFANPSLQPK